MHSASKKQVLMVFDKFRDTITARDICRVITGKIHERMGPDVVVHEMPISDGGDGFVECMAQAFKQNPFVDIREHEVLDPLRRPTTGTYLVDRENDTAYIEVANCSGLSKLKKEERNPYLASSVVRFIILVVNFKLGSGLTH